MGDWVSNSCRAFRLLIFHDPSSHSLHHLTYLICDSISRNDILHLESLMDSRFGSQSGDTIAFLSNVTSIWPLNERRAWKRPSNEGSSLVESEIKTSNRCSRIWPEFIPSVSRECVVNGKRFQPKRLVWIEEPTADIWVSCDEYANISQAPPRSVLTGPPNCKERRYCPSDGLLLMVSMHRRSDSIVGNMGNP